MKQQSRLPGLTMGDDRNHVLGFLREVEFQVEA